MIENNQFIQNFMENIHTIRDQQFKKYDFNYEDVIIEKKNINENSIEFKNFKNIIKKKALLEKYKPGNIGKKEYENIHSNIDILEDDIFKKENGENNDLNEIKINIETLDREKKIEMIHDFLQRKNILLDENNLKKIEEIIDDTNFILKKYINISKLYQQITKIGFIKKLENGSYIIDLSENKQKKNKNYFHKN